MKQQPANMPPARGHDVHEGREDGKPAPLPTVGTALDGSQFQNIVEEQKYSEQRPGREEQHPGRAASNKPR